MGGLSKSREGGAGLGCLGVAGHTLEKLRARQLLLCRLEVPAVLFWC